jgi:hypothetical protein
VLIPVTGADFSQKSNLPFSQQALIHFGIAMLGLGLVTHGISLRMK